MFVLVKLFATIVLLGIAFWWFSGCVIGMAGMGFHPSYICFASAGLAIVLSCIPSMFIANLKLKDFIKINIILFMSGYLFFEWLRNL